MVSKSAITSKAGGGGGNGGGGSGDGETEELIVKVKWTLDGTLYKFFYILYIFFFFSVSSVH